MSNKITNLKDFIKAYSNRKSDVEISNMLNISIDEIKSHRKEISTKNRRKSFRKI